MRFLRRHPNIEKIVSRLESADEAVRKSAYDDLRTIRHEAGFDLKDGLYALRAAARPFPVRNKYIDDPSKELVYTAAVHPRPEYVPVLVEQFPHYSGGGKDWALHGLARLNTHESLSALVQLLDKYAGSEITSLPPILSTLKPEHPDALFPQIFAYATHPDLASDIYHLALRYAEAGLLTGEKMAPFLPQMLEEYHRLHANLEPRQQPEGVAWMYEDAYRDWRGPAGILLDLFGHLPTPEVKQVLRDALDLKDPRLKHFALASLLQQGEDVAAQHIDDVAASPEMRGYLYTLLDEVGKLDLFPERFRTQEALAEANMVDWLTYPTELASAPDEIELMKVVSEDLGPPEGVIDYYLFRYRTFPPHWAAEKGWMAGVSGPFLRNEGLSTESHGDTFSTFEPWDSITPDEHVAKIRELMDQWRDYHFKADRNN
ncbi:MAG: hypothetical protein M3441_14395 [Chloroflexota bacterium]|nr:hypothetical protein [Chloroflexota bacterium]